MERYPASALEFIARIKGDGSGLEEITPEHLDNLINNKFTGEFKLTCLSMSNKTYIASNFSTYIVKLKPIENLSALMSERDQLTERLKQIEFTLKFNPLKS
jgi:hypothetical protein